MLHVLHVAYRTAGCSVRWASRRPRRRCCWCPFFADGGRTVAGDVYDNTAAAIHLSHTLENSRFCRLLGVRSVPNLSPLLYSPIRIFSTTLFTGRFSENKLFEVYFNWMATMIRRSVFEWGAGFKVSLRRWHVWKKLEL